MASKSTTTQTTPQATEGQLVHTEFITQDPKGLRTFLEKNFGWKFETVKMDEGGDYHLFTTPGGSAGGITAPPMPSAPIAATPYIFVKDVKATAKKVEKAGATIVMPPTPIPNMGSFFLFQVKGSPILGCWQGPQ